MQGQLVPDFYSHSDEFVIRRRVGGAPFGVRPLFGRSGILFSFMESDDCTTLEVVWSSFGDGLGSPSRVVPMCSVVSTRSLAQGSVVVSPSKFPALLARKRRLWMNYTVNSVIGQLVCMRGQPSSRGWVGSSRSHHQADRSRVPGIKKCTTIGRKYGSQGRGKGREVVVVVRDHASSLLSYHRTWDPTTKQASRMGNKTPRRWISSYFRRLIARWHKWHTSKYFRNVYHDSYGEQNAVCWTSILVRGSMSRLRICFVCMFERVTQWWRVMYPLRLCHRRGFENDSPCSDCPRVWTSSSDVYHLCLDRHVAEHAGRTRASKGQRCDRNTSWCSDM